jgi:hypothetical protein
MRNFLNLTKKFSDFSTFTRTRATFSRICQRLFLATIATFEAFSDFQNQTHAGGHGRNRFSKSGSKKSQKNSGTRSGPAPMQAGGRRFLCSGCIAGYVQDVTQAR